MQFFYTRYAIGLFMLCKACVSRAESIFTYMCLFNHEWLGTTGLDLGWVTCGLFVRYMQPFVIMAITKNNSPFFCGKTDRKTECNSMLIYCKLQTLLQRITHHIIIKFVLWLYSVVLKFPILLGIPDN